MTQLALIVDQIEYSYRRRGDSWQLQIPRFELAAGDQNLLTGGSGRGKSTLLHLIAGLIDPRRGTVTVDGQAIHSLRGAARDRFRGREIGMIFQTFNLLHGFTALENVLAPMMFSDMPKRDQRDRAKSLLSTLGIDRPRQKPERMSVGQQQRVAVARALACRPSLVLADEPTASLDPENAGIALDLIQETCRNEGASLLITSHDPALPARFPETVTLDELANGQQVTA